MTRHLYVLWLLVSSVVAGCMSAPPIAATANKPLTKFVTEQELERGFNISDSDQQQQLVVIDHELVGQMIAEAPNGSNVSVAVDSDHSYTGTLIKGRDGSIELLNCICKEPVPGPGGFRQCKTSHVPLQSFQTAQLVRFAVTAPPPAGFKVPDFFEDPGCATIAEIVFKDGHSVGRRREPESSQQAAGADFEG